MFGVGFVVGICFGIGGDLCVDIGFGIGIGSHIFFVGFGSNGIGFGIDVGIGFGHGIGSDVKFFVFGIEIYMWFGVGGDSGVDFGITICMRSCVNF